MGSSGPARVRVERGIYRQPNGKYAVCWRHPGRLRSRTVGFDLSEARRERLALIAATREGQVAVSPRLRFETVAGWWLERFEATVAAGERHPRTLETHRYQLERNLLPGFGRRAVAALTVDDVAELLHELRRAGRSAKTAASALATLQSVMRFARRCGWIVADPVERLEHDERPRPQRRRQRVLGRAEIERLLGACSTHIGSGANPQAARTGCSRRPAAHPTATATSAAAASDAPHSSPDSTTTAGRHFASTTCATPTPAT